MVVLSIPNARISGIDVRRKTIVCILNIDIKRKKKSINNILSLLVKKLEELGKPAVFSSVGRERGALERIHKSYFLKCRRLEIQQICSELSKML